MFTEIVKYLDFSSGHIELKNVLLFFRKKKRIHQDEVIRFIHTSIDIPEGDINLILKDLVRREKAELSNSIFSFKSFHVEQEIESFKNELINEILSIQNINSAIIKKSKFKVEDDKIFIDINSIKLNYRKYIIALQRIGFLSYNEKYSLLEVKNIQLASKLLERPIKKLTIDQFHKIEELKSILGDLAEDFVLEYEKKKLENYDKSPKKISQVDVGAGYDIISYNHDGSLRHIEVKGIHSSKSFHWSKNEVNASIRLNETYFIYCVGFEKLKPTKIIRIINDPYKDIFKEKKFKYESTGDFIVRI